MLRREFIYSTVCFLVSQLHDQIFKILVLNMAILSSHTREILFLSNSQEEEHTEGKCGQGVGERPRSVCTRVETISVSLDHN